MGMSLEWICFRKRMGVSLVCLVRRHMTVLETNSRSLLPRFFGLERRCLGLWQGTIKPQGYFIFLNQVSFFFLPVFLPFPHTTCSWNIMCIFLTVGTRLCSLSSYYRWYANYGYKRLNILVCTKAFILSFL